MRVFLRAEPPPGGAAEAELHTMGTFPISAGDTLDAYMHDALQDDTQALCNSHFEKLQVQPSMDMPHKSHISKFAVTRVYDNTRTWTYDNGYSRKDPTRANEDSEQEMQNGIDSVCAIIHLVAPCTHMILN